MAGGKDEEHDLEGAYALETPEDSVRLYRGWAATYDDDFAHRRDYRYPASVAAHFAAQATEAHGPVLDVGCGTGLVGEALAAAGGWALDGLDISPEMLEAARAKGVYRRLVAGDLTRRLDLPDAGYGGVVSAGTFTHGHVGPDALAELMRVARPGALCVLGVNEEHYVARGFADAFDMLAEAGAITPPETPRARIYGEADRARDAHSDDCALLVTFRRR